MKVAFVTGANGFIGSFLVERLLSEGFEVRCFARKTSDLMWIKNLPVKLYYGRLSDEDVLADALKGAGHVFHLAAAKRAFTEKEYDEINHEGTLNLLEACKRAGTVKRFIYVSSLAVAGPAAQDSASREDDTCRPITFYGSSKLKGEEEVRKFSTFFPTVIIRPPAVYGPRDRDLLPIFKAVQMGLGPTLGIRKRRVSLLYVEDLADCLYRVSQDSVSTGETYFISDGKRYGHREIVSAIAKHLGKNVLGVAVPGFLVYGAAFLCEIAARLTGEPAVLNIQKARDLMQLSWVCSPEKIQNELGISAKTNIDEGVGKTIQWYKINGWL